MPIPGTQQVTAQIAPSSIGDSYATHYAKYGKGGRMTVADNTERDAIPTARREEGMVVFIQGTGLEWQLAADLTTWNSYPSTFAGNNASYYLDRVNHTGNIPQANVTGLSTSLAAKGDMFKSVYDSNNNGVVDVAENAQQLNSQTASFYTNRANHTGSIAQADVTNLVADLALKENAANKGAANGYAPLVAGLVPLINLPPGTPNQYLGLYDASTNTPGILNGVGVAGEFYIANVTGNAYAPVNVTTINQIVAYDGAVWQVGAVFTGGIADVNGYTGPTVTLDLDDIANTATRFSVNANQSAALNVPSANAGNKFVTESQLIANNNIYYITPDEFADGNIIGDNTTRTLVSLGYNNGTAAATWPLVAANAAWVGAIDVITMTIDWIAIQEAFLTIEQGNQRTSFLSPNGARKYRVNNSIKLPRYNNEGSDTSILIDFSGSKIINVSGNNFIVVDRFAPDTATALGVWGTNPLHIKNLSIVGNGTNTNTSNIGLRVAPNFKGSYINVFVSSCAVHVALYFNLLVRIQDCQFTGCGLYCIVASDCSPTSNTLGYSWIDGTNSNSQCNAIICDNVRFQPQGATTVLAAYYAKGGYNHIIKDSNAENLIGTAQYILLYEGNGDPSDSLMFVQNFAFEINGNIARALVGIKNGKGIATIQNLDGYVTPGTATAFIEADNRAGAGTPTIVIRDCENAYNFKFRSIVAAGNLNNARDRQFTWRFEHVGAPVKTNIFDPNNWVTTNAPLVWDGVTPNSIIPDPIHVSYKPIFSSVNDFNFNGVNQFVPDVNDWLRTSPIVGTNSPTAENLIPDYIGQLYLRLVAPKTMYIATGTSTNADWEEVTFAPLSGAGSPVGTVTPKFVGQTYVKTGVPKAAFISTGLTSADWLQTG
jgi:hypothetical protein